MTSGTKNNYMTSFYLFLDYDVTLHPYDVTILFLDYDVIIFDDVNPILGHTWRIKQETRTQHIASTAI